VLIPKIDSFVAFCPCFAGLPPDMNPIYSKTQETAVSALLPVYGLHSGIETAYALILVSLFAVGSFAFQQFICWIGDRFTF